MSPPVSRTRETIFKSKDQKEIVMLLSYQLEVIESQRIGKRMVFSFNRGQAEPLIKMFYSNKPMPVSDIHCVLDAYELFTQIIHGDV